MISALDQDLYKLTTLQLFWKHLELSQANATYKVFTRRSQWPFSKYEHLKNALNKAASIKFTVEDIDYLHSLNIFDKNFLGWLRYQRLQTKYISLFNDCIEISGPLLNTTLWEIPILSAINELNQKTLSREDWIHLSSKYSYDLGKLHQCNFAEFGSRRRHSLEVQEFFIEHCLLHKLPNFLGTSNLYLAKKYGVKPVGTIPHEYPMALSALYGEDEANKMMCEALPDNGIALTDTFTTDSFLRVFNKEQAQRLGGLRVDSGDPLQIIDKITDRYWYLGINPDQKTIICSDGLNPDKCIKLQEEWGYFVKLKFGIGTYFSNPFNPIDCVMKLTELNGQQVYKISDDPAKSTKD